MSTIEPDWSTPKGYQKWKDDNMKIPRDEFCARFKAYMLSVAGDKFNDGESIAEYADSTAPTYYDEPDQRADGPEECASADMSYWGDE